MPTVLVVSTELASYFLVPLAEEGYRVFEAGDSGEALQQVMRRRPDVIIMPDEAESVEGVDLLPVIRGLSEAGIIVVGDGEANKMAKALFEGADVYMKHPVGRTELRSRLRSLIRRQSQRQRRQGDSGRRLFTWTQEQAIQPYLATLSPVERRLFTLLLRQGGSTVRTDQLVEDVWGAGGKETSLRFYIRRLREKLEPDGLLRILNRKGIGYRVELPRPTATGSGA